MVHRAFTIANLALLTAAIYFGVSIFYTVLLSRLASGPPPVSSTTEEVPPEIEAPSSLADYMAIVERTVGRSGQGRFARAGC
jgi:hypothetical protein